MDERRQGGDEHHRYEKQPDQDETQDESHEPARDEYDESGHLVPERLQGVKAYPLRPVFEEQPDDEGAERHETNEHAQARSSWGLIEPPEG